MVSKLIKSGYVLRGGWYYPKRIYEYNREDVKDIIEFQVIKKLIIDKLSIGFGEIKVEQVNERNSKRTLRDPQEVKD